MYQINIAQLHVVLRSVFYVYYEQYLTIKIDVVINLCISLGIVSEGRISIYDVYI